MCNISSVYIQLYLGTVVPSIKWDFMKEERRSGQHLQRFVHGRKPNIVYHLQNTNHKGKHSDGSIMLWVDFVLH